MEDVCTKLSEEFYKTLKSYTTKKINSKFILKPLSLSVFIDFAIKDSVTIIEEIDDFVDFDIYDDDISLILNFYLNLDKNQRLLLTNISNDENNFLELKKIVTMFITAHIRFYYLVHCLLYDNDDKLLYLHLGKYIELCLSLELK